MTGTENIKRQNDKLHAGIDAVAVLRDELGNVSPELVRERLDKALAFFRHDVGPHARAEERVFYPEVSKVLGVDLGERMVGEHRLISTLVSGVTELRHRIAVEGVIPVELYSALGALVDMVESHLRLEEEVLVRMAQKLSDSDAYFLYERMEEAEFDAVVALSAPPASSST